MSPKRRAVNGFTLVELLVVIGIIALLIGILLPTLAKARDQANIVKCAVNERTFFHLWQMYSLDSKNYALPAYAEYVTPTGSDTTVFWWDYTTIGMEMNKTKTLTSGASGNYGKLAADDTITQEIFTCPSANHSGDPAFADPNNVKNLEYHGDYIYNYWMGILKTSTPINGSNSNYAPFVKTNQIPSNVILLAESSKPNAILSGGVYTQPTGYKEYFPDWGTLVADAQTHSASLNRGAAPHGTAQNAKCNILMADGHVVTINPYTQSLESGTATYQAGNPAVPYTYDPSSIFKNYLIGPAVVTDINGANPPSGGFKGNNGMGWTATAPGF